MKALIILLLIATTASAQTDTTHCLLRVQKIKKCKSKQIRGYEVTTRNSDFEDLKHVAFLYENKKRIRPRKNRRVCFVESLM
jgi:hypothetical protein